MNFCVINTETNRIVAQFIYYADAQAFLSTRTSDIFTIQDL